MLDFRQPGQFPVMSPKDSIFHRYLETTSFEAADHRQLQFQGERCNPNVFDVASKNPDLSTFVQLLKAAGLEDIFKCAGPFTLLAPTNEAFSTLDPHMLAELLRPGNQKLLQELLLYHILPGFQPSSQLQAGSTETLLYNSNVTVGLNPIMFNDANVVMPDIMACNGVIYTIDQVLVPMKSNICDAFTFGNSTRRSLQNGGMNCTQNVLQTAEQNPELTTIVSLIKAAGLEDIFSCAGPFTALLPDNAAFNKLDPAFIQFLMDPANHNYLQDLLLYHILPGATMSSKFQPGPTATLLLGETVNVTKSPLMFNDAGVTTPDIVACNGYIDIINTVLLPFAAPTAAPTAAPILAPTTAPTSSICANYTFPVVRFRKLQKGGANCTTNVLDTARLNPDLSIVTMLIDIAGLAPIFNCAGPFTALFPTNEAINALDPTFIASLTNPANVNELRNVLLYHVLPGATLSTQFTVGPSNTLFTGNQVNVTLSPLLFNGVGVNKTDVTACNGYIDILNGVLNPFQIIGKYSPTRSNVFLILDSCPNHAVVVMSLL